MILSCGKLYESCRQLESRVFARLGSKHATGTSNQVIRCIHCLVVEFGESIGCTVSIRCALIAFISSNSLRKTSGRKQRVRKWQVACLSLPPICSKKSICELRQFADLRPSFALWSLFPGEMGS
ncbi:hypothetical protein ISCGN_014976 [Ixodes scapularis]